MYDYCLIQDGYIEKIQFEQTEEWKRARLIAYYARFGSHIPTKKIQGLEEFLPLEQKKKIDINELKELFKQFPDRVEL